MNKKGIIAIISGFSGVGKGTIVKELVNRYGYVVSISATTRKPREGEVDGKSYFFKTQEEFEQMIKKDELMEYAQYVDHYYGTPKKYVMEQLEQGNDVLLEIEMQGALKIKEKFPEVSLIFITPPSVEELKNRLINRGTETMEVIENRVKRDAQECVYMQEYNYIVENDSLEVCIEQIHALLQSILLLMNYPLHASSGSPLRPPLQTHKDLPPQKSPVSDNPTPFSIFRPPPVFSP